MRFQPGFRNSASAAVILTGANYLLTGETDGYAIDATTSPPTVAVKDTGTPANNLSNVDFEASNLTNAGTSPKLVHHVSTPYVRWSPHNLFLNSASPATQNVTLVVGFVYTVTVTGAGGGSITGSAGASGVATTGSPATFTATTTTGTFTYAATLTTIQLNRGSVATAYVATTGAIKIGIPQSYDAAASKYGILVEPAATNLTNQSEVFGNAYWTKAEATIADDNTAAPDATTTADKLTGNSVLTNAHMAYHLMTGLVSNAAHTASVFAKKGTNDFVAIGLQGNTSHAIAVFDLNNGVVGEVITIGFATATSSIVPLGNGWYRCVIAFENIPEAQIYLVNQLAGAATGNTVLSGNSGQIAYDATGHDVYFWGAQFETGSVATSYIPTLGSTVTRAADDVNALVSTMPWSATVGTVYADYLPSVATGTQVVWHADDGTGNERIYQYRGTSDPLVSVIDGGVNQLAPLDLGTITGGARSQTSFAWKANDFAGSHGGAAIVADTGGTIPTMTAFRLGTDQGSSQLNGLIKRLVWVPRRVIDGDLPTWRYNF